MLACPDAFKQTASSQAVAAAIAHGARAAGWGCDLCPLSDGGEGFADVVAGAAGAGAQPGRGATDMVTVVTGPLGQPVSARWYLTPGRAVIESAAASGLGLAGGATGNDPVAATSRGTGELIIAAVAAGARQVLVGVGGSATTDGGSGALAVIEQAGGLGGAEVVVACDVETTFVEAAPVFGPQKGASAAQVEELRDRLVDLAERYRRHYGVDVTRLPGSGAAGGLGGGLAAIGARLAPGMDVVADAVGLDARLEAVPVAVTGEGCLDGTSWVGKVVGGVARRAARAGVFVVVVVGSVGDVTRPGWVDPAGLEIVSLTDRFGDGRARSEPEACTATAVRETLEGLTFK